MKITGRILRAATIRERRVLKALGLDFIRVPRRHNPFAVARLVRRISFGGDDLRKLQQMVKPPLPTPQPRPVDLPDSQSTPREQDAA